MIRFIKLIGLQGWLPVTGEYVQRNESGGSEAEREGAMSPSLQHRLAGLLPTFVVGYFAFIVYGSLIPFELRDFTFPEAIEAFRNIRYLELGVASRGDWVANILLYVPLGFLLMANGHSAGTRRPWTDAIFILLFCSLVAFTIEFLQIFFKPRTVSENDLIAEHIGSALGIIAWWAAGKSLLKSVQTISLGGRTAVRAALIIYTLALFALALFPFDILISLDEVRERLDSDLVALLVADRSNGGFFRALASFFASTAAYFPIGLMLQYSDKRRSDGIAGAVILGALFGTAIEALQFFVASAVSEGLGIVSAVLGVSAGYIVGNWSRDVPILPLARRTGQLALLLLPAYLLAGMALNGWFSSPWQSITDGLRSFNPRSLIPFYYHYFTTEAAALRSTIFNAALYLPIGLVFLALRSGGYPPAMSSMRTSVLVALGIAFVFELGKLFVTAKHPDFTNLIIAALSSAGGYLALSWLQHHWRDEPAVRHSRARESEAAPVSGSNSLEYQTMSNARVIGACTLILLLVALLVHYPLASPALVIGLVIYALLIQRILWSFLVVLPVLLVTFDKAAETGWFFVTEFDFFVLATIIGGLLNENAAHRSRLRRRYRLAIILFATSTIVSLVIGLWPPATIDGNAFNSYLSQYNALRVGKAFLEALLLLPLLRAALPSTQDFNRYFFPGVLAGLICVLLKILWERMIFPGLFDFAQGYRATGLFSALHTGGALIDGYLALMIPFILTAGLFLTKSTARAVTGILILVATYAVLVTYSRITVLAVALCGLLFLAMSVRRIDSVRSFYRIAVPIIALVVLVSVPIFRAPYIQSRFDTIRADLQTRFTHWQHTIALKPEGLSSRLWGTGLGSFPRYYFVDSLVSTPLSSHQLVSEADNNFLRISDGRNYYVIQQVEIPPGTKFNLRLDLRAWEPRQRLTVLLCEQALLYSYRCQRSAVTVEDSETWQHHQTIIENFSHRSWRQRMRPVYLVFYNSGTEPIDIDSVHLLDLQINPINHNGTFDRGLDHWYFVSDDHLRWHIKNLPLAAWFEQGWFGVLALVLLVFVPMRGLVSLASRGDQGARALLLSLTGFCIVSLTSSLFDFPRLSFQFFLVLFASCLYVNLRYERNAHRARHDRVNAE